MYGKVRVLVEVEVDVEGWANAHGVHPTPGAVEYDVLDHLQRTLDLSDLDEHIRASDVRPEGVFAATDIDAINDQLSAMPAGGAVWVRHVRSVASLRTWLSAYADVLARGATVAPP